MHKNEFFTNAVQPDKWSGSYETQLAQILGWAVERGIPFHEAILALIDGGNRSATKRPEDCRAGKAEFKNHGALWKSSAWKSQLLVTARELEKGEPLAATLKRRLPRFVSPFFLAAVEKAEQEKCLAVVLPELVHNSRFTAGIKETFKASLVYPCILFINSFMFIFSLYIFIIPRFLKIFKELFEGEPLPEPLSFISGLFAFGVDFFVVETLLKIIFFPLLIPDMIFREYLLEPSPFFFVLYVLYIFSVVVFYAYLIIRAMRATAKIIKSLSASITTALLYIPLLSRYFRRLMLVEVSGAMGAIMSAGFDLTQAARWSAAVVSFKSARRRLLRFAEEVEAGAYWVDAWERMKLGSPAHNWLLRNAGLREEPARGFKDLTGWLGSEIQVASGVFFIFIETFGVLFNVIIVGITVFAFWYAFLVMLLNTGALI